MLMTYVAQLPIAAGELVLVEQAVAEVAPGRAPV
jgi:hypothetical protein